MSTVKNSLWWSVGLGATACAFLWLLGSAGSQIYKISLATELLSQRTLQLEMAKNWLLDAQHKSGHAASEPGKAWQALAQNSDTGGSSSNGATERTFFVDMEDETTKKRVEEVVALRNTLAVTHEQIRHEQMRTLKKAGGDAQGVQRLKNRFLLLARDNLKAAQILVDGILINVQGSAREIKDRIGALHWLVAGLCLVLIPFVVFFGWKVLRIDDLHRAQHLGPVDFASSTQYDHLTSREEIGQLLKGLATIPAPLNP